MIFDNPIFTEMILPFILIFVVVFAILQRSKILGDGKKQIDALVSLSMGLLLIGVPAARDIVSGVIPWLAVGIVFLLFFFLLYGFSEKDIHEKRPKWLTNMLNSAIIIFIVGVIIFVTPLGSILLEFTRGNTNSGVWSNVFLVAIIIGVVVVAVNGGNWGKDKE